LTWCGFISRPREQNKAFQRKHAFLLSICAATGNKVLFISVFYKKNAKRQQTNIPIHFLYDARQFEQTKINQNTWASTIMDRNFPPREQSEF
jgi:hypothetical protein